MKRGGGGENESEGNDVMLGNPLHLGLSLRKEGLLVLIWVRKCETVEMAMSAGFFFFKEDL